MDAERDQRIELLAQSLDFDPADASGFEAVVKLLTEREDWQTLERAHRKLLFALVNHGEPTVGSRPKEDVTGDVWMALHRLYLDRLGDLSKAITVLEFAVDKPSAHFLEKYPHARFDLASLYEETGQFDLAVRHYEAAAELSPGQSRTYRRLFDIHMHRGALDAAWCAASALAYFDQLAGTERDFFEDHLRRRTPALIRPLDTEDWNLLRDEQQEELLTLLIRLLIPFVHAPRADAPPAPGSALWWALGALRDETDASDRLAGGISLDLAAEGAPLRRMLFVAGREAVYSGEPWADAAVRVCTPRQLSVLVWAALQKATPATRIPETFAGDVAATKAELDLRVPAAVWASARHKLLQLESVGIGRWRFAVMRTAARAGLLLAGDLCSAKEVLYEEPPMNDAPTALHHMSFLIPFMASSKHVTLRARLGLSIGTGADAP